MIIEGRGYVPGWFYTSRARRHAMLLHTTHQGYMISLVFEGNVSCALGADMGALGCVVGVGGSVSTIRWLVVGLGGHVQDVTILLHNLVKRDLIKRATEHQTPLWSFNSPSTFGCTLLKLLQVATIAPSPKLRLLCIGK